MRKSVVVPRLLKLAAVLAAAGLSASCMTTYDAAGNPVQSVDPAAAAAAVAVAGVVGYAIANDDHHHYGYYGGYCGPYRYPRYRPYCY
jgi:hypothetical protein